MEYNDDSHTVVYVLAALVLAVGIWFFAIRQPSSDMQLAPPVPELIEPNEAPAAGPLDATLDWPDAPEASEVEWIKVPDVTPVSPAIR